MSYKKYLTLCCELHFFKMKLSLIILSLLAALALAGVIDNFKEESHELLNDSEDQESTEYDLRQVPSYNIPGCPHEAFVRKHYSPLGANNAVEALDKSRKRNLMYYWNKQDMNHVFIGMVQFVAFPETKQCLMVTAVPTWICSGLINNPPGRCGFYNNCRATHSMIDGHLEFITCP